MRTTGKIPLAVVLMLLGTAYSIAALRQESQVKLARGMIARSNFLGAVWSKPDSPPRPGKPSIP